MDFQKQEGRIFALGTDGELLAEVTFPTGPDGIADINHTFVDESLRGQGWPTSCSKPPHRSCGPKGGKPKPAAGTRPNGLPSTPRNRTCWPKVPEKRRAGASKSPVFKNCFLPVHVPDIDTGYS